MYKPILVSSSDKNYQKLEQYFLFPNPQVYCSKHGNKNP